MFRTKPSTAVDTRDVFVCTNCGCVVDRNLMSTHRSWHSNQTYLTSWINKIKEHLRLW